MGTPNHCFILSPIQKPNFSIYNKALVLGIMLRYQLTLPLARVALLLADGYLIPDICKELHISDSSARTYTKIIYSHLQVHNQVQVAALIWKTIAEINQWKIEVRHD